MDNLNFVAEYVINIVKMIRTQVTTIKLPKLKKVAILVPMANNMLSLYYYFGYGLSPCIVDLDDLTTIHFWVSSYRRHGLPNLLVLHGYGGDSRWQFALQMKSLSKSFNIYMPDLPFFGNSYTNSTDRSPEFLARCVMEGLKRGFGVKKFSVYAVSYGGWVGYRMAQLYPQKVERIVIVSSGIGCTNDQMLERLEHLPITPIEKLILPRDPKAMRLGFKTSVYKSHLITWLPDFFLSEILMVIEDKNRKEKEELLQFLMSVEINSQFSSLSQETLLVWGNQDELFPIHLAYQLQRMIGPNAKLEILEGSGHAVNLESPCELNKLIKVFILAHRKT